MISEAISTLKERNGTLQQSFGVKSSPFVTNLIKTLNTSKEPLSTNPSRGLLPLKSSRSGLPMLVDLVLEPPHAGGQI